MPPVGQRLRGPVSATGEPLVGRLPADAEASSKFGCRIETTLVSFDEGNMFEHGIGMALGHGLARLEKTMQVNRLSPIKPVKNVTHHPGLYH